MDGRPNDERAFVHRRIIGAVGKIAGIAGIPIIPGIASALTRPRLITRSTSNICPPGTPGCPGFGGVVPGGPLITGITGPCPQGTVPDPQGRGICLSPESDIGRRSGARHPGGFGDAEMGQFGAGLQPAVTTVTVRDCPRGAVLGKDGLCYNKRLIHNADRYWPKGRAPLLTGGEMRCITVASRAAKKLERKEKQLRSMGMLKALPRRSTRKLLAPGHHAHVAHD